MQTLVRNDLILFSLLNAAVYRTQMKSKLKRRGVRKNRTITESCILRRRWQRRMRKKESTIWSTACFHVTLRATTNLKMLSVCPWQWRFSGETDRVRFTGLNGSIAVVAVISAIELTAICEITKTKNRRELPVTLFKCVRSFKTITLRSA